MSEFILYKMNKMLNQDANPSSVYIHTQANKRSLRFSEYGHALTIYGCPQFKPVGLTSTSVMSI